MEKDMRYYVQISNQVMLENLKNKDSLTRELLKYYRDVGKREVCIIASGSSLNAALAVENFLIRYSGCHIEIMSPTEYMDYKKDLVKKYFFIVISQSGCSTNIIESVRQMNRNHTEYVVLTGNSEGALKKETGRLLEYGVGNETIDYVTLGFSTLMEYLILFAVQVGKINGVISEEEQQKLIHELEVGCRANRDMYIQAERFTKEFHQQILTMEKVMIIGDGANVGTAREAALKFQETLKIPAVYYESEEFIHGSNMQLTPEYTVFFIDTNPKHDRMQDVFEATRQITRNVYMITNKKFRQDPTVIYTENRIKNEITPLFTIVPFQYIAAVVTKEKNNFECHPLFKKFEERIHCKTDDYETIMKEKIEKDKKGERDA